MCASSCLPVHGSTPQGKCLGWERVGEGGRGCERVGGSSCRLSVQAECVTPVLVEVDWMWIGMGMEMGMWVWAEMLLCLWMGCLWM